MRLTTCPWQALKDPFVATVQRSHRWFRERQLETRWGGRVPSVIVEAVEAYDATLNAVQVYDMRERQKRDEAERERVAQDAAAGGFNLAGTRKLHPRRGR